MRLITVIPVILKVNMAMMLVIMWITVVLCTQLMALEIGLMLHSINKEDKRQDQHCLNQNNLLMY